MTRPCCGRPPSRCNCAAMREKRRVETLDEVLERMKEREEKEESA